MKKIQFLFICGLCGVCIGLLACCGLFYYAYCDTTSLYRDGVKENATLKKDIAKKDETVASLSTELDRAKQDMESDGKSVETPLCVQGSTFKSYMDYRTITAQDTKQYKMVQKSVKKNGLLYYDGCVCVALGSYYGKIGTIYRVTLGNGTVFKVVKAEEKSDADTVDGCYIESNGNMIEFVVDTRAIDQNVLSLGDISYLDIFKGPIVRMERLEGK